jgi:hypothetical protein
MKGDVWEKKRNDAITPFLILIGGKEMKFFSLY